MSRSAFLVYERVYFLRRSRGTLIPVTGACTPFRIYALLLLCLPALALAQQSPTLVPLEAERSSVPSQTSGPMPDPTQGMIRLDVVVTDKSGNPVTGLRQQDFTLQDKGQPAKIVSFQAFDGVTAKPDPPVEVILVIDELNMPPAQLSEAEREAENFLRQNEGHLGQPVSIYRLTMTDFRHRRNLLLTETLWPTRSLIEKSIERSGKALMALPPLELFSLKKSQ